MATSQFSILVLLFLSLTSLSLSQRCHPNDKKALLQIKKDLRNPAALITWQPKTDCCNWSVATCDDTTNRITIFYLSDTDLRLPIPAAVGDLAYLQHLTFYHTNATGQIPRAISKLSDLNLLDLRFNLLTGPVPDFLGRLKKLTYIGLSYNNLRGSIPASLSQLQALSVLFLNRNKLTGSIPESFADFKHLNIFLSHNSLSGPIPAKLGSTNFSFIDVSRNKLEGDISFFFGKNKSLNYGDFSSNQFQFDLSKVVFPRTLSILYLNHNKIYGSLPKGLIKNRIFLNVSDNQLCGPIPAGGAARLEKLNASNFVNNKCLCGAPLPKCK